jgi:hypothetical protein
LSKTKLYGKKETLNTSINDKNSVSILKGTIRGTNKRKETNYYDYSNSTDLVNTSNEILKNSFAPKSVEHYYMYYISCTSDHTYIDFFSDYDKYKYKDAYGYNSLPFMEQVIEKYQIPCILLQRSNVIPQIIGSNYLELNRIDDANLKVANAIAQQNVLKNFRYQGTIPLHSMYVHFLDIGHNVFISPGSFSDKETGYSGLYTALKSTYTKKFDMNSTPAEYRLEMRQESTGVNKITSNDEREKEAEKDGAIDCPTALGSVNLVFDKVE